MEIVVDDTELINAEKNKEIELLTTNIQSVQQSLQKYKEKISLLENEKSLLEQRWSEAQENLEKLNGLSSTAQVELEQKIIDLKCQLSSAKERIKTEIPKLERDNINKAENILELNLSLDSLKEEIELLNTKTSCLEAEKKSLNNVLEEMKTNIGDYEQMLQDKQLKINVLEKEVSSKDALCQDLLSQYDSISLAYQKQNDEMKRNADLNMELISAEDKISDLEMQLSEKDKEVEQLSLRMKEMELKLQLDELNTLKENLADLQAKYDIVVEERDKHKQEVCDLMGHQNIHQKIRKVSELKQYTIELKNENALLRLENQKLKSENQKLKSKQESSKLKVEDKENVSVHLREDKQKGSKPVPGSTKKKPMSPHVLKSSNH